MSFRFGKSELPGAAARRVFLEELDRARAELLTGVESAVALHEVRKRIKKLRALIRLVRPALGAAARTENRLLRDVGRMLAHHREIDAVDSLLVREASAAGSADVEDLRSTVRLHQVANTGLADRERDLENARRSLLALRRRIAAVVFDKLKRHDCRRRLRKSYKRTRRAYRTARENASDEALHRWRQSAKTLLNHTRLLAGWGGATLTDYRRRLVRLDDCLGRARDCAFLAQILRGVPAAETPLRYGLGLRARLEFIARDEIARAFQLGGRLFRRSARGFVDRMIE